MAKMRRKKPELKVVFDTSVIHTKVSYYILNSVVRNLIVLNSKHSDLIIKWYLPHIVVDERRYQMQCAAFKLLPYIEKLEKLLGHNLNINEKILIDRINNAIKQQLGELDISNLEVDTTKIDLEEIIKLSVFRQPPFEQGDKEKGFRDTIVAETFLQLVNESPITPSVCRLAIVANDNIMKEYLKSCTKEKKNVRILSNVSELEGLINTLVSKVTEKFIEEIKEKVKNYFFEEENKEGLFYKENIEDKIKESYSKELTSIPKEDLQRENGTWKIAKPVFVKKRRQRTFWVTTVAIEVKLFRYELPVTQDLSASNLLLGGGQVSPGTYLNLTGTPYVGGDSLSMPPAPGSSNTFKLGGWEVPKVPNIDSLDITSYGGGDPNLSTKKNKINVSTGHSIFEINWSVNVTPTQKLTNPRIEEIKFVKNKWGDN